MKKIMFNDRYGLTKAVLEGRKTMTRRSVPEKLIKAIEGGVPGLAVMESKYKVGEVVAVAQSYKDVYSDKDFGKKDQIDWGYINSFDMRNTAGFTNKMFVRADLMPHQIRITNVRVERLQDISDEDCKKEGLEFRAGWNYHSHCGAFDTPREAFAALIDKVSGKGTFESNPWVFVYKFELVK